MQNATRENLAAVARAEALLPYHGHTDAGKSNLQPIIRLFPKWNVQDADDLWCAAFVYYCLVKAGFVLPYSPDECRTCSLAGCGGFEEFAMGDARIEVHLPNDGFCPSAGDIVLYDRVFADRAHDHMGIVIGLEGDTLIAAEGNVPGTNTSGIVRRRIDSHIRCYVRIPDGYRYSEK